MNSRYFLGLLLIVFASCSSPLTQEQKNADAVYLKQIKEYTLNLDGSSSYHYYHKFLYNSYLSFNRFFGETFVDYNPEYQSLKVNKSETEMADGKKVKSPENAFNEVLPSFAADAPDYNNLREMVITHVGLERGAVVELDYDIQTKKGFMPFISDKVNFCESSPVKEVEVIVRVPKGVKLNYNLINKPAGLTCKKSTKGEFDVYSWKSYNLSAISHEPLQSEGFTAYPTLQFSTVDLATAFNYLKGNLAKDFTADESAKNLLASKEKSWEKVELVKNYVVSNINTYGVLPQLVGYRFRSPEKVWQSNGGTESEKAILLAELLKNAGFNAQMVIAEYPSFLNKEVGNLSSFDKFWVKVELDGETRFISAVDEHSKILGQRIPIAIVDDISKVNLEISPKPNLQFNFNADLKVSVEGKVDGTAFIKMNSFEDSKDLLKGISSSDYTSTKTSCMKDSIFYSVSFTNSNLTKKIDEYYMMSLPCITQGIAANGIVELPLARITNIELLGSINESYSFAFTLPKGFNLISPMNEAKVENSLGMCDIVRTEKDGKIIINRKLVINKAIIPTENYSDFRQIMTLWSDKNLNKVVIKGE
ncbi:MAG: DUF3857 domain-containing protein [Bacteroidales bacterium]|nr:DUF3857 domain-containing protein [Bacteroidales bacterium]